MMKPAPALAGLEDLAGRAEGIGMRPTLLRVLTDLYLQRPSHTPEDERYYTELVLRLIDATDASQRIALATRLARYPSAPRAVIERLARDAIEVAAPILQHSPCLTPDDLEAIARDCGGAHAQIVADRIADWPAAPPRSHVRVASSARRAACELSELFFAAGTAERRLILINLDYAMLPPSRPSATIRRTDVWRLESAALRQDTEALLRELERTLGISRVHARRAVDDRLGEPIVVAGKAMNLPVDAMQRILLFTSPRVGLTLARVHDLIELYNAISVDAARRLIAIWRTAAPVADQRAEHEVRPRRRRENGGHHDLQPR
jgi:hypothetical protein